MNPHVKEDWFLHYLEEKKFDDDFSWKDTRLWVKVGGLGLLICTISIGTLREYGIAFRIVDEDNIPLLPLRNKDNNREPAHFSFEPHRSKEDLLPITFHMIANCQYAKLQINVNTSTVYSIEVWINSVRAGTESHKNNVWNHKTISTMTAIPLIPHYQGGANTIFTYPQSRTPRASDDDKPPVIHKDKINPSSSSGVPPQ